MLSAPAAMAADTVGLVDPSSGIWYLVDDNDEALSFYYGNPDDYPFAGDWDCDGTDTPGLYRQSDGWVYLRNTNTQGVADISFFFGNPGDVRIAGDFNGDGCDTVSVYRPSEQTFYIINELGDGDEGLGAAEIDYVFGDPGDIPFTGDFDDDDIDTVGLYRTSNGLMYFKNSHTTGNADDEFYYGNPDDLFVAGDWTGDGTDTPGVFRPADVRFYLRHMNTQGTADDIIPFGAGTMLPVAGDWGDIATIPDLAVTEVASGLSAPMMATAPDGDDRLFIPERSGAIKVLDGGEILEDPFLTVSGVSTCGEGGVLGLAFHPGYSTNGRFFVHYTGSNASLGFHSRIVEYHATPSSDTADVSPVRTILTLDQPACNHNAGSISFGPDGNLYILFGDGGSVPSTAQNPHTLLGSVLRINIDGATPYSIPSGNPYDGSDGAPEVWALGLRNPYRSSIDPLTGDLYIGDVGQSTWEEVSIGEGGVPGLNYGWNTMEGPDCYSPSSGCNMSGLTLPVVAYDNSSEGRSVVGGHVYRGDDIAGLQGVYFYADFFNDWVRSFRLTGTTVAEHRDWESAFGGISSISGFGVDGHGEIYIVTISGTVYKIIEAP
jgi:glucose/arabinose dehydrogenase